MEILVLADFERFSWDGDVQDADLLLSCGDVPEDVILQAVEDTGCEQVFAVKGNHDKSGDFADPIVDLHMSVEEFRGVKFGGFNGCWKYKPRGHFLYEESEVQQLVRALPSVDIFLAHNSPRGIHDREDGVHQGFQAFNVYIEKHKPSLFIHGHQHISTETKAGPTRVVAVYGHQLLDWEPEK